MLNFEFVAFTVAQIKTIKVNNCLQYNYKYVITIYTIECEC